MDSYGSGVSTCFLLLCVISYVPLSVPKDRGAQAKMAYDLLEGFANEAQWDHIRKERHAKAAEEAKKEAANEGWTSPISRAPKLFDVGSEKPLLVGSFVRFLYTLFDQRLQLFFEFVALDH